MNESVSNPALGIFENDRNDNDVLPRPATEMTQSAGHNLLDTICWTLRPKFHQELYDFWLLQSHKTSRENGQGSSRDWWNLVPSYHDRNDKSVWQCDQVQSASSQLWQQLRCRHPLEDLFHWTELMPELSRGWLNLDGQVGSQFCF